MTDRRQFSGRRQEDKSLHWRFHLLNDRTDLGLLEADGYDTIGYANTNAVRMLGDVGACWLNHIHADDRERVTAAWVRALNNGDTLEIEFHTINECRVAATVTPVDRGMTIGVFRELPPPSDGDHSLALLSLKLDEILRHLVGRE